MTTSTSTVSAGTAPAESITNDEKRIITDAMIGIGENFAQGDLYFVRIPKLPKSAKARANRQLADGTTQGSRHVCEVGDVFDADAGEVVDAIQKASGVKVGTQYIGPIVHTKDGVVEITHPEHGDHEYHGNICLATVFQRVQDAEEREAISQD